MQILMSELRCAKSCTLATQLSWRLWRHSRWCPMRMSAFQVWLITLSNRVICSGPATRIVDSEGRLFIYRSRRSLWQKEALPSLASAIQRFAERTVVKAEERAGNLRGPQNFCIAGTDRQSKGVRAQSKRKNLTVTTFSNLVFRAGIDKATTTPS